MRSASARLPTTETATGAPSTSARRLQQRLPEVEEGRLADAELAHLLHRVLQLARRFLALALAGVGLRGEVEDLRPVAVVVPDHEAAEHVRPERGHDLAGNLRHDLLRPLGVADVPLHDLDEAGPV